jgi:hypothetical protein
MPRTDENGRQLKALLDYLLDGEIDAKDIYDALATSSSTYYRRIKEDDYPKRRRASARRRQIRAQLSRPADPIRLDESPRGVELHRIGTVLGDGQSSKRLRRSRQRARRSCPN